ncbi:hypothetical protein Acsp05_54710 [Actinokineospora sp. NBRC 105648]|nr:hypothetical protein Acsp05_54710 [Actinokineospora sp. NBRC 105648]
MGENNWNTTIDRWLDTVQPSGKRELLRATDRLTAILVASTGPEQEDLPDEVFAAWQQVLVRQRLTVLQSEIAFIEAARHRGRSWRDIAQALNLPPSHSAEEQLDILKAEAARTHPANEPRPFLS